MLSQEPRLVVGFAIVDAIMQAVVTANPLARVKPLRDAESPVRLRLYAAQLRNLRKSNVAYSVSQHCESEEWLGQARAISTPGAAGHDVYYEETQEKMQRPREASSMRRPWADVRPPRSSRAWSGRASARSSRAVVTQLVSAIPGGPRADGGGAHSVLRARARHYRPWGRFVEQARHLELQVEAQNRIHDERFAAAESQLDHLAAQCDDAPSDNDDTMMARPRASTLACTT